MSVTIPTSTELVNYIQTTSLDGRDYILRFLFNRRDQRWRVSFLDQDESPIRFGVKVVADSPLLRRETDDRRPKGILLAKDLTAVDVVRATGGKLAAIDPSVDELGDRVKLIYFTEAETS